MALRGTPEIPADPGLVNRGIANESVSAVKKRKTASMYITTQRIIIVSIVGLLPVFVYCLLLIGLNTRRRASMVPGTWDCAGVLLANSGFLLAGGPLILAGLDAGWRRLLTKAPVTDWRRYTGEGDLMALGLWAFVFLAAVGGALFLILRRRHVTVLYNVDTKGVPASIEYILNRFGVKWQRKDHRFDMQLTDDVISPPSGSLSDARSMATIISSASVALLMLPASCNVTLVWSAAESELRRLVEGELSQLLPNLRPPDNPAVNWLVTTATTLAATMILLMAFVIWMALRSRNSLI